ncbi:DUF4388 domain-containing protein [Aggregicoccus sp. 17bor-14]|uniref:DUF4388 domain-containing protein n=1 Tax=Myxococcaceae TaxID=31 RepID=UPI00129CB1BD|nr:MULTISPECIES: DUF4388 domain-containing protein [Myxococcaceae]MBF5042688.1 DUF4388 domain-containing protein [Simulacricoccus sp. 17bor-14]MRI88456.1 DUF4388 domain-containing protein [Aggregicoccus sp. 17bor-14]
MTSRFRIDASGQLVPAERQASPALGGRGDTYALMTGGSGDLLVFARSPAQGGSPPSPPRVVLSGDASGFPISDLIAFLSQMRWSGVIRVHAPGGERSVMLREGEVRGATSDDPAERLGELLIRLGYVERGQLEETLREHPPSKVGRALVEKGLLQAHDLFKCVTHQVSEIFHAIVLCREGAFFLVDQPVDDKAGHTIQLSTQSLLMDSIRKIDEMAHFRKRIPHGRLYVARKRGSDGKLEEDEDRVLALLDGQRTLLELGRLAQLGEFDVTKVVFRLLEGGFASLSERPLASAPAQGDAARAAAAPARAQPPRSSTPAAAAPAPGAQDALAVVRIFNFIFREIRDEVAKQAMDREFIAAANAALANQALSASPVLEGLGFAADGSLPEGRLVEAFERHRASLGSEPVASFKQALSDVMFFLLFQAGELLESRADEDLARRVKELLATLDAP